MQDVDDTEGTGVDHPKHISEQRVNTVTTITLEIDDPLITPHGKLRGIFADNGTMRSFYLFALTPCILYATTNMNHGFLEFIPHGESFD